MKRSKALVERRQSAVEEKSELLRDLETAEALKLHPLSHSQRRILEVKDLCVDYGGGPVCPPLSFTLERGERVASGAQRGGKSSLLKLLLGQEIPTPARCGWRGDCKSPMLPRTPAFCGEAGAFARESDIDESLFKAILRKLDFRRVEFEKDMADYSGGQKKKVLLARSLCQQAHLYLWDEPLNFVDVYARMQIEDLLLTYQPTMIFVEHDRAFTEQVATSVVEL